MTGAMRRAVGGAVVALALFGTAELLRTLFLCASHRAWVRVRTGRSDEVLSRGENIIRPGDAIFVCEVPHHAGPIVYHQDLDCYCAPATWSPADVAARIEGTCVLDKLTPSLTDSTGSCRFARCNKYVNAN
jgi:hypothetical protein